MIKLLVLMSLVGCVYGDPPQCGGGKPMQSIKTYLGKGVSYDTAENICCNNHHYAEHWGYFEKVGLFQQLDPNGETVFYDSVCGIPLFIAPKGRTFAEWRSESEHHGWPSFRPEEIVTENVIIHPFGRMESKCGTHLGHNIPSDGRDRYCIDLVCIAGEPDNGTIHVQLLGPILNASQFDPKTYVSIAPVNSGKQSYTVEIMIGGGLFFVTFGAIAVFACNVLLRAMKKKQCRGGCCKDRRAVGVPLASKAEHGEQ